MDPLCEEAPNRMMSDLGCYACTFNPETSCEHRNMFLDRMLMLEVTSNEVTFLDDRGLDEVYVLMGPSSLSETYRDSCHAANILDTVDRSERSLLIVGYMMNSEELLLGYYPNVEP